MPTAPTQEAQFPCLSCHNLSWPRWWTAFRRMPWTAFGCGFNRSLQRIGEIVVLGYRNPGFSSDARSEPWQFH